MSLKLFQILNIIAKLNAKFEIILKLNYNFILLIEDAVRQFLPNKDELHYQKPNSLLGKHKRDEGY